MFVALEVSIQVLEQLVPLEARIRQRSAHLATQLAKAADSISLNLGEGRRRRGGDRRHSFDIAAGSADEVTVALRVARVRRYVSADELAAVERPLDRLRGLLWGLTH